MSVLGMFARVCICLCVDVCIYQELGLLLPKRKQHTHIPRRLRDTLDRLARPSGIWASDAEKEAIFSFTGYHLYETLHSAMCFGITSISGNDQEKEAILIYWTINVPAVQRVGQSDTTAGYVHNMYTLRAKLLCIRLVLSWHGVSQFCIFSTIVSPKIVPLTSQPLLNITNAGSGTFTKRGKRQGTRRAKADASGGVKNERKSRIRAAASRTEGR